MQKFVATQSKKKVSNADFGFCKTKTEFSDIIWIVSHLKKSTSKEYDEPLHILQRIIRKRLMTRWQCFSDLYISKCAECSPYQLNSIVYLANKQLSKSNVAMKLRGPFFDMLAFRI